MDACLPLVQRAADTGGHKIGLYPGFVGWAGQDKYGSVLPAQTLDLVNSSQAILLYAVGLPARDHELPLERRPERGALLPLRFKLGLATNIRPIVIHPGLENLSPLRPDLVEGGLTITFYRELLGGDYFGKREESNPPGAWAADECRYAREEIEAIARAAFTDARATGRKVTSLDKANVLVATGRFWREVVQAVHDAEFPDVPLEHQYIDSGAAALVTKPKGFQILLGSNAHGDIASDVAAAIAGSLGMLPSASINPKTGFGLYEPGGGSAPDLMGKNLANPIAMVLSIAMMFRYSLKDEATARRIEAAVQATLRDGFRTTDIAHPGCDQVLSTTGMARAILGNLG